MRKLLPVILLCCTATAGGQSLAPLTVEKIMRDPEWIGSSPSRPRWSFDSHYLLFEWNPAKAPSDSVYYITPGNLDPQKSDYAFRDGIKRENELTYNKAHSWYVYAEKGDIFLAPVKGNNKIPVTQTTAYESNPLFAFDDKKVVYQADRNLFAWDIETGTTEQLTNFQTAGSPAGGARGFAARGRGGRRNSEDGNEQEAWLGREALENSAILRSRKEKRELAEAARKNAPKEEEYLQTIAIGDQILSGVTISPSGRFVTYRLIKRGADNKNTIVPNYVTESGFTEEIPGRTKVGSSQNEQTFYVYDRQQDTVLKIKTADIPGIKDIPEFWKDYPEKYAALQKKPPVRAVNFQNASWSPDGTHVVVDIFSQDNKDRWLMLLDPATGNLELLDRQHDEAWIGGPGVSGYGAHSGWIDEDHCWFQSEETGYSHLYIANVTTKEKKALTSGDYEVQNAQLSADKKYFYITTNEVHPGEKQFYRLTIRTGKKEQLTTQTGANEVQLSPDEKWLAILYSYSNKPWELYLQENKPGAQPKQVTHQAASKEFLSYPWRDPQVITFKASDGALVHARLFKPAQPHPARPAVIFVHGAGYLQNAHKWWSSYFREYMFHNLLADNGYTVLDIDYRGSAGYGRDWRTAIYRHMGGKDLGDQVDGAKYLVDSLGVDPAHIGIYGGSYGGFITLMALFTDPGVFNAGAALRSVTDWAHYNHGYTSNILNEPFNDSIAYYRSSPINFASGLQDHLLMCHGMVDVNVHFQDIVRLTQKLIELGKDNWNLAVYPVEDHGFVEPSSWTDEYKRIFKLFETWLKP